MREQTGDLWEFWSTGAYIGITTNGRVSRSGEAVMGAGLAKVAAAHGDVDAGNALVVQHSFENVALTK